MIVTHPTALDELDATQVRLRALWAPPPDISIEQWAHDHRILPTNSGRPGQWVADPIQREIQASCCDPEVREVVFQKATRLGWSEICNNTIGWGVSLHGMAMLMLQPSRDTAEQYCKDRLEEMIERTPDLASRLRVSTSKGSGSTTRYKRFNNGASFFVASAGNPRELRSTRARFVIEDEADGYKNDVSDEGDPDKIVRRRMDEYYDSRLLIGSTPGMPTGVSRIEKAYNRSSQGIYLCPCPKCNALEPFLWRDPANPQKYLLKYDKDKDNQVLADSVRWTCIRCGHAIDEKWKVPMMEAGHWKHRRPDVRAVKGYWANGLYAMFLGHWAKLAQEWVDSQGDPLELKSFINLNLAETYSAPGEAINPKDSRKRADLDVRERAVVPDGVALVVVTVDVQTAGTGRLEAQVVGFAPDERAYAIDYQVFMGNPQEDKVWEDLDTWLLTGWRHQNGAQMTPHGVFIDARDGNVRESIFNFCAPREDRWIFPQMGVDTLASKGWCEESSSRKHTQRFFLTASDDCLRVFFARQSLDPNAPKSVHIPSWTSDDYHEQLGSRKRMPVTDPKTKKTTYQWVRVTPRNEVLDCWKYAYSLWWAITKILAPHLGGPDGRAELEALAAKASLAVDRVTYDQPGGRRILNRGIHG